MLTTNTTINPYLSILQLNKNLNHFKNLILIHTAHYTANLNYLPLIQKLKKHYKKKLHIQTIINQKTTAKSLTKQIPTLIKNKKLKNTINLPINKKTNHIILYNNPQIIHNTQQLLKKTQQITKHLHHQPNHITTKHY